MHKIGNRLLYDKSITVEELIELLSKVEDKTKKITSLNYLGHPGENIFISEFDDEVEILCE